jgi:hypothetical protein
MTRASLAKRFFATLKKEFVHRQSWPSMHDLGCDVFEHIEAFYNAPKTTLDARLPFAGRLREREDHDQQRHLARLSGNRIQSTSRPELRHRRGVRVEDAIPLATTRRHARCLSPPFAHNPPPAWRSCGQHRAYYAGACHFVWKASSLSLPKPVRQYLLHVTGGHLSGHPVSLPLPRGLILR